MGRASENDVVLHDQGVSRRHARILSRGGRHYVIDLGSAKGTSVNGKPLARDKEHELRSGDRLAVGPIEFLFTALNPTEKERPAVPAPPLGKRGRSSTLITRAETQQEMQAIESEDTGRFRTLPEMSVLAPLPKGAASSAFSDFEMATVLNKPGPESQAPSEATAINAPRALHAPATIAEMPIPTVIRMPAQLAKAAAAPLDATGDTDVSTVNMKASPKATAPSAAERARLRRQQMTSLQGQLLVKWRELPPRLRAVAGVVTGLFILMVVLGLLSSTRSVKGPARPSGPEPTELGASPVSDSFGLGDGVTWKQPDAKGFEFQFASPTRALAVLHYQARDISQSREVSISLNGVDLGWVPTDSQESEERELQLLLPLAMLRRGETNRVTFDNVLNPPAEDRWRVWNVYVEVIPVPELPQAQLMANANKEAATARRFYEQKDVGSENLYKSWKLFRSSWITLEAMERKPEDLYEDVRYMLARTAGEMDQTCRKLMLDFQRSIQYRDGDKALATVQEVIRRFPTTEHRCHNLAIEKATEYELPL
nr:FHA domain-containing protein [Hyalangium minutum]